MGSDDPLVPEKGGPMIMWDIVAQKLEALVEKVEHWKVH